MSEENKPLVKPILPEKEIPWKKPSGGITEEGMRHLCDQGYWYENSVGDVFIGELSNIS
jgi:hypothetical protein